MNFTVYVVAKEVQQPHGTSYLLYYKNYKKKGWVRKTEEKLWNLKHDQKNNSRNKEQN